MDKEVRISRKCTSLNKDDLPCGSPPLYEDVQCFMHSPKHREDAQKARSLGGQRRRKEQATQVIFDLNDLTSLEATDRIFEIVALDTLQLDNTPARSRALIALIKTKIDMNKHADLAQRIAELEEAIGQENAIKH